MTESGRAGGATHTGCVRNHNEDCIAAFPERGLYVVADGMGGQSGGDVASGIAVEKIDHAMMKGKSLREAIIQADRAIAAAALSGEGRPKMGTTIVLLQVTGSAFHIAWVGDSRAYRINNGIERLSHDHSVVQELIDRGAIEAHEARHHPRRNVITRALGSIKGDVDKVDEVTGTIRKNDIFLLCTDGLYGLVPDSVIEKVVSSHADPQVAADVLVQAALDAGGWDNISVLVVGMG
jgi:serine/threonine protein phosphatase PrpC